MAAMPTWRDRWIEIGLGTGPADRTSWERGARGCYETQKLPWPGSPIWVSSPIVGALAAPIAATSIAYLRSRERPRVGSAMVSAVDSAVASAVHSKIGKLWWHEWMGGQFWPAWHAWRSFFLEVCNIEIDPKIRKLSSAYGDTVMSACYWWPDRDFVMVCERPIAIRRNARGQLHADGRLAIEWPDGWGLWMLNGVNVGREIAETPAENLNPHMVLRAKNVKVRRELVRKIGIERVCSGLNAQVIDSYRDYELLILNLGDARKRPYLKMKNPSIDCYHVEGVPPDCKTVREALAWRNNAETLPGQLT